MAARPGFHMYKDRKDPDMRPLTSSELNALQLAADGNTSAGIARIRGHNAADNTHPAAIYVRRMWRMAAIKLGADNITHAVALGLRRGIIK